MENLAFEDIELSNGHEKPIKNGKAEEETIYTYEEAITLTGTGKFHKILLLTCGMCFMATMVEIMGVSLVMELAKCDFEFNLFEQGILASSGFFGVVSSSHAMGFLADTCGRAKTLRYALVLSCISSIASVFSVSVWMLIITRFLVGFFISGCQACVFSFIGEFHGKGTRIRNVTMLSCFLPLGLVVLPALATIILPMKLELYIGSMKFSSWRFLMLSNGIPTIIALIGMMFFPESPKYLLIQGQHDQAIEVMKKCYAINTNNDPSTYPVKKMTLDGVVGANFANVKSITDALKLIWTQTTPLFHRIRVLQTFNIFFLQYVIFIIGQGTFMWFPVMLNAMVHFADTDFTICESVRGMSELVAENSTNVESHLACEDNVDILMYKILIGIGAGYTGLFIVFSYVIGKIGKRRLVIIWMMVAGSASVSLYWTENYYLNLVLITLCISVGNCGGIINAIAMEFYPTNINAMAMCLIMMIGRLGAISGSNVIGIILTYNCELLYVIYGVFIFSMVPLSYLLPSTGKK